MKPKSRAFKDVKKQCLHCGKPLVLHCTQDIERKKYCSHSCVTRHRLVTGLLVPIKKYSEEQKEKLRKPHRITPALLKAARERGQNRKGVRVNSVQLDCQFCGRSFWTPKCRERTGKKYCDRKCFAMARRKPEAEKTDKNRLRTWALQIYKRDGNCCVECGVHNYIHAHHIIPKAEAPDKWYDVDNGETLCLGCHAAKHGPHMQAVILSNGHGRRQAKICAWCGACWVAVGHYGCEKQRFCSRGCASAYVSTIRWEKQRSRASSLNVLKTAVA